MEDFDSSFSVREIIKDKLRQNFDGTDDSCCRVGNGAGRSDWMF